MKESLMNQLRTKGFSYVSCDCTDINKILEYSITVYIQENKYSFEDVDCLIEDFLDSFIRMLKRYSERTLDHIKERLRILKQRDDVEIFKQQYIFDRYKREALAIENININKLITFLRSIRNKKKIARMC
ncbi:Nardilysin [Trachymyrmex septentrionalis]|uniref:Nardilysin n=1 Tax=Trachymyrmex septentrionalis TaxID=34720 RepID=A0A195EWX5_9HYME|nr:Nardilysin [Trachymyrmex septentrionalis]